MPRILQHDDFYGRSQFRRSVPGFTLAHRIAEGPADAVDTHTHVEAHFVLVTSGQYISSARGEPGGSLPLVYNPPGTTHRDHLRSGAGTFFTVSVTSSDVDQTNDTVGRPASLLTDARSNGLARALFWHSAADDRGCDLDLEFLSQELLDSVRQVGRRPLARSRGGKRRRPAWLRSVYEKLEDSYAQQLTVSQLAAAAAVHRVHLARTFRVFFGCTPGQFIQLRRLEKAADLLLGSRMGLSEIAIDCGFTDQSHMTTSFRRVYGMPPGQFRRAVSPYGRLPHVSFLQDIRARLRTECSS